MGVIRGNSGAGGSNTPPTMQQVIVNSTWTKPEGLSYIILELVGGGAGGGGCYDRYAAAGGGGGEVVLSVIIAEAALGTTETITIGDGGDGGIAGAGITLANLTDGFDGGATSFGSHVIAAGGKGGPKQNSSATNPGGLGGTSAGPGQRIPGAQGGEGNNETGDVSGVGGNSLYGTGGHSQTGFGVGLSGTGYGAGGSGASDGLTDIGDTGGDGTGGFLKIIEYFV